MRSRPGHEMVPFMFGEAGRRLFGVYHPAAAGAKVGAVLICSPFGQEAIQSHRVFRALAERLAASGYDVLRFDYFGTGDSAGDDEDGDLAGWARDVCAAHHELLRRAPHAPITWIGSRLGASIMLQAETLIDVQRPRLVLWDPIVDGSDYLSALRIKHVETLESSYSVHEKSWRTRLESDPKAFADEAIGFGLSAQLRRQIGALSPQALALASGADVHVIARPDDAPVGSWIGGLRGLDAEVQHFHLVHELDWTSESMLTEQLPPSVSNRLMSSLRD